MTSLDGVMKKDRHKPDVLLTFFHETGVRRVSTFEMTNAIWRALQSLERDGLLTFLDSAYPWHKFTLRGDKGDKGSRW